MMKNKTIWQAEVGRPVNHMVAIGWGDTAEEAIEDAKQLFKKWHETVLTPVVIGIIEIANPEWEHG